MRNIDLESQVAVNKLIFENNFRFSWREFQDNIELTNKNIKREMVLLLYPDHLDDQRFIDFEFMPDRSNPGIIIVTPKNLFTFLLLCGEEVHYDLVRGRDRWQTRLGIYRYRYQPIFHNRKFQEYRHINIFEPFKIISKHY